MINCQYNQLKCKDEIEMEVKINKEMIKNVTEKKTLLRTAFFLFATTPALLPIL